MKHGLIPLTVALVLGFGLSQAQPAHAANCAFLDLNNDGLFNGADVVVPDNVWLNGVPFATTDPFVVPAGCNYLFTSGIVTTNGVRVSAPKITFNGVLHLAKPGGQGIRMVATGPEGFISDGGSLKSGGVNAEFAPNKKRSVMVVAETGPCVFTNALLEGIIPTGSTNVGVRCQGDVIIRGSKLMGALVNVRSVAGKIEVATGPIDVCGVVTFPPSLIQSSNDPVILIAFGALVLDDAEVSGRYRVLGVSQTANISTKNSLVHNGASAPNGGHIAMFPHPTSVNFAIVDFEDVFGPSAATLDITSACYQSPNPPRVGQGASLLGVPDAPCDQASDFVFVLNAIY
jgi:hypothetical protein